MPHSRLEYEKEVSEIDKQIAQLESRRDEFAKRRSQLDVGQLVEAKRIRKELDEVEGGLSDLKLLKQAANAQLAKWKKNAPASEMLRQQVAEMHEEERALVDKIIKAQNDVTGWLQGIDVINAKIGNLAGEHLKLIGEDMHAPLSIQLYVAMGFAGTRIQNYDPWTYVSDDEYAAQAKAERAERRRAYEKLLKLANDNAPECPRCADTDEAVKMQVDLQQGGKETPGQGIYDGHWSLVCPRCRTRTGACIPQTKTHG